MKYQIQNLEALKPKPKMRKIVFGDMFNGDIFQARGTIDYELYMCIQTICSQKNDCVYNAISLVTGKPTHFEDDEAVELYDGMIIFNEALFKREIEIN